MSDHDDDKPHAVESHTSGAPLSRRTLFKTTAGAVVAAAGSALAGRGADAQVTGILPPGQGGGVPFYLPLCSQPDLDRNQYWHNFEIHAKLATDRNINTGDGSSCPLWVRGAQRILTCGIDITDPKKPFVAVDAMPIRGPLNYVTHLKKWIGFGNVAFGMAPGCPEYPRGYRNYTPEGEVRGENKFFDDVYTAHAGEFRGIIAYDVTDPSKPVLLSKFSTGKTGNNGHAHFWDGGRYMYLMGSWDESLRHEGVSYKYGFGLQIVDVWDPANIKDVAKWWVPGQRWDEEEEYRKFPFAGQQRAWAGNHGGAAVPRRVEDGGKYGYCGMGHFGMYVLDLTDIKHPKPVGHVAHPLEDTQSAIPYHTCFPVETGKGYPRYLIGVVEENSPDSRNNWHTSYMIDIQNPQKPKIVGLLPRPVAPKEAPWPDFACNRGRFGFHNSGTWAPPGDPNPNVTLLTAFNAGLRFYDISDPTDPKDVAYFVPAKTGDIEKWFTWQRNPEVFAFIEWDRNLIWASDSSNLYCLSTPLLGKPVLEPRKVEKWAVPHVNVGWDDQTPTSVYFGRPLSRMP